GPPCLLHSIPLILSLLLASFSPPFSSTHSHHLFFFNHTATTEIYTLSLHDALPISWCAGGAAGRPRPRWRRRPRRAGRRSATAPDRKSTRLNSSHDQISYAVFCLKKKKKNNLPLTCNHC